MYNSKSMKAEEFINHDEIMATLKWVDENKHNEKLINEIMAKAERKAGLNHREAALILEAGDKDMLFSLAKRIKKDFYGNRIVLFAPLYLSNHCVNGCVYCPFNLRNKNIHRRKLTQDEIRNEVTALQDMGHKRLALETGEDPINNPIEYILESIETIYALKHKNGSIRRVNVNIAATTVDDYKMLKNAGIGTYILFQETYHKENYEKLHPTGPKSDYAWHTEAMDRAMQGGIDDVGIGVLYGLENYRYEFVAMMMHAGHLESVYGVGPHTVSVPRIKAADGVNPDDFTNGIDDETFKRIVACIRISAPYTGIIISTRESEQCRKSALEVGASQLSGGSRTSVGGYSDKNDIEDVQFDISDNRTLDQIVQWLIETGHIPSFCTACYKEGRTGDRFMSLIKSGEIQNCCHPNALMTLKEYLTDYAHMHAKSAGELLIKSELKNIPSQKVRSLVDDNLNRIKQGSRGFRI